MRQIVAQLQGLELPGPAWERDVLPARIADYDPADLEQLCLAGEVAWGRLAIASGGEGEERADAPARRRPMPTRAAPLAFMLRADLPDLLAPAPDAAQCRAERSPAARAVLTEQRGRRSWSITRALAAAKRSRRGALGLVAAGWSPVTASPACARFFAFERRCRAVLPICAPARRQQRRLSVGRWALLRDLAAPTPHPEQAAERAARRLLRRWGVVFRELCARERGLPGWRALLLALRRLEARGEIRGGRFVDGFVGEQFALPEAVDALRSVRRRTAHGDVVVVAAADPLNLVGVVTPGASRLSLAW